MVENSWCAGRHGRRCRRGQRRARRSGHTQRRVRGQPLRGRLEPDDRCGDEPDRDQPQPSRCPAGRCRTQLHHLDERRGDGTGRQAGHRPRDRQLDARVQHRDAKRPYPAWWVTHIDNGETTTVGIDATVTSSTLGGRSVSFSQERTIETDLLSQFNSTETRPVEADQPLVSDPVIYINETTARGTRRTSPSPRRR